MLYTVLGRGIDFTERIQSVTNQINKNENKPRIEATNAQSCYTILSKMSSFREKSNETAKKGEGTIHVLIEKESERNCLWE